MPLLIFFERGGEVKVRFEGGIEGDETVVGKKNCLKF
jgi:hypothetical protein